MKISILGGGPAGLYFATSIKQARPDVDVTVYEAKNESVHSLGLGYTLQTLGSGLLARQDPDFRKNLFQDEPFMVIDKALFKTNDQSKHFDFTEGFSVTRNQLMKYLMRRASQVGVSTIQRKLQPECLKDIQDASDLVVGADGVNSLVRQAYPDHFGAQKYQAKLKYSWFINESPQERREACFYAFQAPEGVITLTSYPLTINKQVVIIEASDQCLARGKFASKSPSEVEAYLSEILSANGDDMRLTSAGLPWYSFNMNTVNSPSYRNMALIGDAAFSFHFSLGQGVSTAFTMGYILSQCISKAPDIQTALKQYDSTVKMSLSKPTHTSLQSIRWLENMDEYFKTTDRSKHLDMFRLKHDYERNFQVESGNDRNSFEHAKRA